MSRLLHPLTVGFMLVLVVGCSDPASGRYGISGSIKLHGQPIKDGAIVMIEPLEGQEWGGQATTAGGQYSLPKQAGLKPGRYLIRVTAGDGKTPVNPVDPKAPPGPTGNTNIISKELVPPEWSTNSKQEITVTKDGPNRFDFDIP